MNKPLRIHEWGMETRSNQMIWRKSSEGLAGLWRNGKAVGRTSGKSLREMRRRSDENLTESNEWIGPQILECGQCRCLVWIQCRCLVLLRSWRGLGSWRGTSEDLAAGSGDVAVRSSSRIHRRHLH